MNRSEAARLLALVASFNNRTIGEADVVAWQSVLDDIALADAEEAVRRHFRKSAEWIMPVHIRNLAEEVTGERAKAQRKWEAGQYGVPPGEAYPEITGPIDDSNLPEEAKAKLRELLTERFGPSSREALRPRTVFWEREHRAHVRVHEPNPLYRPSISGYSAGDQVWLDEMPPQPRVCRGAVCEAEPCVLRDGGECG